jgi:hypothetical protein
MNAHDVTACPVSCDTEALNTLLRGELAAIESYAQAISAFEGQRAAVELHRLRDAHAEAAGVLRELIVRFGATPADGSGPWSSFTTALGPATVLRALHEAEQHAVGEYEAVLTGDRTDPDAAQVIRTQLLPRGREHVLDLDRLMAGK